MREPRDAAHPMEKTAAGVYANSPTGALASTAHTTEDQNAEIGGGPGDAEGC